MADHLVAVARDVEVTLNDRGKGKTGAASTVALLGVMSPAGPEVRGIGIGPHAGLRYLVLGDGLVQPQVVGPEDVASMEVVG